jgi:endonuclease YncB( thermonuclease family)
LFFCGPAAIAYTIGAPPLPASDREVTAQVRHVVDGDTLVLSDKRHVRLIGINTPERGRDGSPDQPLAHEARVMLHSLVDNKTVRLQMEQDRHDRYGRLLAHVILTDGRNVQEILLRSGLAFVVAIPPNVGRLPRYQSAEREARNKRLGVWGHPFFKCLPAENITSEQTGFRRVCGTIREVRRKRRYIYFVFTERFSLSVPHKAWQTFGGRPEDWFGQKVEARGWVTASDRRLRLSIKHPSMLTRLN